MSIAVRKGKSTTVRLNGTLIPGLTNVKPGGITNAKMEVTELDSTCVEYDSTLPEYGPVTGKLKFDPAEATHLALYALAQSGETGTIVVSIPARGANPAKTYTFAGLVEVMDFDEVDPKTYHKSNITIQPAGAVT